MAMMLLFLNHPHARRTLAGALLAALPALAQPAPATPAPVPAPSAPAPTPDAAQARGWAAACFACHGPDGRAAPGSLPLAGMPASVMEQAMRDFRTGTRPATVMHQIAKGYTGEQVAAIARWFAAQAAQGPSAPATGAATP